MTRPVLHRAWLPTLNEHEANTRAAITDPRPEPGYLDTLDEAFHARPRLSAAAVITAGACVLAIVQGMLT